MSLAFRCLPVLLLAAATACGRDGRVADEPPAPALLAIEPAQLELYLGQRFSFDVVEQRGLSRTSVLDDPDLELAVDDPRIVRLEDRGAGVAFGSGRSELSAELGLRSARASIDIRNARLIGISVTPPELRLAAGEQAPLVVTGQLDDGSQLDLSHRSSGTTYQSNDPSIATVSPNGAISAVKVGATKVRINHPPSHSTEVEVQVLEAVEQFASMRLLPEAVTLRPGQAQQLRAFGVRADGTTVDLVASGRAVVFASDDASIAAVDGNGRVSARRNGTTRIVARLDQLSAAAQITVRSEDDALVSLEVRPRELRLRPFENAQLQVIGTFRSGATRDLTSAASGTTYDSSNRRLVGVTPDGLVTPQRGSGVAGIVVRNSGIEARVTVSVIGDQELIDLLVVPENAFIGVGERLQLMAIALFSDGTQLEVTFFPETTFTALDRTVRMASTGVVEGRAEGVGRVRVQFAGLERTVAINVGTTQVVQIRIDPPLIEVATGELAFLRVIALFSDGQERDVTFDPGVFLRSDNPMIADLVGPDQVLGNSPGRTTISASFQGAFAIAEVLVQPGAQLVAIQILGPGQLGINESQNITVLGFLADGNIVDLTFSPGTRITVLDPTIVQLQGNLATGRRAGLTTITAESGGFRSALQVRVVANDPVVSLSWVPATMTLAPGASQTARLIATHQSGQQSDVTFDLRVMGSAFGPIDLRPHPNGIEVTGLSPGQAGIEASYLGFFAQLPITITGGAMLVSIDIRAPAQLQAGQAGPLQVLAFFSDGSTRDITFDPSLQLTAAPPGIVALQPGSVAGLAPGRATITAVFNGFRDTATVDVVPSPVVRIFWQPGALALDAGTSARASLMAQRQDGTTQNITGDMRVTLTVSGPVRINGVAMNGYEIFGVSAGNGAVQATFEGFGVRLPVTVRAVQPALVSIRIEPNPLQVDVGATRTVRVIGLFSDGSSMQLTSGLGFSSANPMIAGIDATSGAVTGVSAGNTQITVVTGMLSASALVEVRNQPAPVITNVTPSAIPVGSAALVVDVTGTGFGAGMSVRINGQGVPFFFLSTTRIRVAIPESFFTAPGTLSMVVENAGGVTSNAFPIEVGSVPTISNLSPNRIVLGATTQVIATGTGLSNLTINAPGLVFGAISSSADGTSARFSVVTTPAAMPGVVTVSFSNRFGTVTSTLEIVAPPTDALTVGAGQTRILSGTQVFTQITVEVGGRIVGSGLQPLSLVATGNIEIRGVVDVSGRAGDLGSTIAADGGEGGPGGAGGGAAGDGDTPTAPVGGAGSPPGGNGGVGMGPGTPAGNGGGDGGGIGGNGGCARAGGGGGLDGAGGAGGGNNGPGSGGAGGAPGAGSRFRAGTGGGGGSTCGSNSGGGGGGGGGALVLQSLGGTINVGGQILANGGEGGEGFTGSAGGGGGSGGRLDVISGGGQIRVNGAVTARGGNGGRADLGATGGGGAGGRIRLDARPGGSVISAGTIDAEGGLPGGSLGGGAPGLAGQPGSISIDP